VGVSRATRLRRGDAKWDPATRRGPGLYHLDVLRWGVRITLGWSRDERGVRNPLVDEAWLLEGYARAEVEAWRRDRVALLEGERGVVDVLAPDGRSLLRLRTDRSGDGPRKRLTDEGRARRTGSGPPPEELWG
jgi:hypothetical protein